MTVGLFETLRRGAAAGGRRASGRALGGAALTGAIAAATSSGAGKAGKNARRRCQKQRGACSAAIEERCASNIDPAVCEAALKPCCGHFGGCNAGTGILCLFNIE